MIDPATTLRETIHEGSVFYFVEEAFATTDEPHYFVVLNHDPASDKLIMMVCASTKTFHVKLRSIANPNSTLIEVTPKECLFLKKNSIFDCNYPIEKHFNELAEKLKNGQLQFKGDAGRDILEKLRKGVLDSPQVPKRNKKLLEKRAEKDAAK